jgi:hypothetical protein
LRLFANICTWWRWQISMGSHKMCDWIGFFLTTRQSKQYDKNKR